ncbi:lymphocyte function-associated antigen 3-like [Brachyhypopomus gauderio]|uniref:lymphocyte function-associated antigen 3-like n=1 Tax=Brachyhypopomus gauderio TaxID=698409 RepID=UPI004043745E
MQSKICVRCFVVCLIVFDVGHVLCEFVSSQEKKVFSPGLTGTPESILWKHNSNKVVEYENDNTDWYRFKEQADLDILTGSLTFHKLHKSNSGSYEYEIQINGQLKQGEFKITVIDPVLSVNVTCQPTTETLTLRCSAGPADLVNYTWQGPNGFTQGGSEIKIKSESKTNIYYCTAANKVNNMSIQFQLKDCFAGSPEILGYIIGLVVFLLIGFVVVGFILWKKKKLDCINDGRDERNPGKNNPEGMAFEVTN